MFEENGIHLEYSDVQKMFDFVDDTKTGALNLEKFKAFSKNREANEMFKGLIKKIREDRLATSESGKLQGQLPFNFNIMLEYLSNKQTVQEMWDDINDPYEKFAHDDTTFNKFKKLFTHHIDNMDDDLNGQEELKNKLRKEADLKEQKDLIKTKTRIEMNRR